MLGNSAPYEEKPTKERGDQVRGPRQRPLLGLVIASPSSLSLLRRLLFLFAGELSPVKWGVFAIAVHALDEKIARGKTSIRRLGET